MDGNLRNHQQGILCIKHLLKIWLRFNCIGFLIMLSSVAEHAAFSLQTQDLKPEMSAESISSRYPIDHPLKGHQKHCEKQKEIDFLKGHNELGKVKKFRTSIYNTPFFMEPSEKGAGTLCPSESLGLSVILCA